MTHSFNLEIPAYLVDGEGVTLLQIPDLECEVSFTVCPAEPDVGVFSAYAHNVSVTVSTDAGDVPLSRLVGVEIDTVFLDSEVDDYIANL